MRELVGDEFPPSLCLTELEKVNAPLRKKFRNPLDIFNSISLELARHETWLFKAKGLHSPGLHSRSH